ncbi:hypothetical protein RHMOL_Rhmol08G0203800 [Rhododendron molle]|uniref:Uncharacterized protein n=1 Tax=Rhododendron molle TaxID=49168 RepID=A0ACC0MSI4_RHOML|nr:hypothetical protein RHMOL_Rhmol08G0203800 [Rhododendron molle]
MKRFLQQTSTNTYTCQWTRHLTIKLTHSISVPTYNPATQTTELPQTNLMNLLTNHIHINQVLTQIIINNCIHVNQFSFMKLIDSSMYIQTLLLFICTAICLLPDEGRYVFDEMPERNAFSWIALITGYTHNRKFREAIQVFRDMQAAGAQPSGVTMVGVLSACAHLGALDQGKRIHDYIVCNRLRLNVFVGTALLDMYDKCGVVDEAEKVFGAMREKNVYTWNVLISGYAMNGQGEAALQGFDKMILENIRPDEVTFLGILCACSHQGFVDVGRRHFISMKEEYNLKPQIEHLGCMVDLLGRAGFLDEAQELIHTMNMKPDHLEGIVGCLSNPWTYPIGGVCNQKPY